MLILFDIDGTLIRCGGSGRAALNRAFARQFGVEGALDGIRLAGSTDPVILEQAFEALDRAPPPGAEIEALFDAYVELLRDELQRAGERFEVLAGAIELAQVLHYDSRFEVGLATGNIERGAYAKLERAQLQDYFSFGGFGSDAAERADLVRAAIERGQARSARSYEAAEIFVIGDTERDVVAARAAGATSVGVLAGSFHPDELRASEPDLLVDDLQDPRLWAALGLE